MPRSPGWLDDSPPPSVFSAGLRGSSNPQMPLRYVLAALALRAEAEVFYHAHYGYGERVVCHEDVNLVGRYAGVGEGAGAGLSAGADGDVAAVLAVLGRFAAAD